MRNASDVMESHIYLKKMNTTHYPTLFRYARQSQDLNEFYTYRKHSFQMNPYEPGYIMKGPIILWPASSCSCAAAADT